MRWPTVPLGEIAELTYGNAFSSSQFNTEGRGVRLVRIRDVLPGCSATFYSGDYDPKYLVHREDVVIGMDGEFNLGRWKSETALLNQRVARVRSSREDVSIDYLAHFLPKALKDLEAQTPFATVKHLSSKRLTAVQVPLPSIDEQRRIAAILDCADALRRARSRATDLTGRLAGSVFDSMFGSGAWPDSCLGDLCLIAGEYGAGVASVELTEGLPRYIRITDITSDGQLNAEVRGPGGDESDWSGYRLEIGDMLFARSGATVGKTYLHTHPLDAVFAGYLIRFRPDPTKLDPTFLFGYTKTARYAAWVAARQNVVAQPNINARQYGKELPIPLPPLEAQQMFSRRWTRIQEQLSIQRRHSLRLDELFTSLQERAFSGRL